MFTKRNIAKFIKDQIIWSASAATTSMAIHTVVDEPTETQEIGIQAGSLLVGYMVMSKVQTLTDRPIDALANWRDNRKAGMSVIAA